MGKSFAEDIFQSMRIDIYLAAITIALLLLIPFKKVYNQTPCQDQPLYVGAPSVLFKTWAKPWRSTQKRSNWCWAASTQMVLKYHGVRMAQRNIVNKVLGTIGNQAVSMRQLSAALDTMRIIKWWNCHDIDAALVDPSVKTVTEALEERWILLAGLSQSGNRSGHVYVLYGADTYCRKGNIQLGKLYMHDPLLGNKGKLQLSWAEFLEREPALVMVRVGECR
jgi:hypothetical protein